jgi:transposase
MEHVTTTAREICPDEYDVFVGMDVDKRSIAMTLMDRFGQRKSLKMGYDPQAVLSYVSRHFPGRRVLFAYEAGPTGFGLHDAITEAGYTCLVVSPGSIPTAANRRVKTNRVDSANLAELLRGGQIRGIRVPSEPYRQLRELVRLRDSLVEDITATKCRIKACLLNNGIAFPVAPASNQWSKRVLAELRDLSCSPVIAVKIALLLEHLECGRRQAATTQMAIRALVEGNSELSESMGYLMSVPGIGWVTASYALARIGDWQHLGRGEELGAFMGLVPTEHSTGDRVDRGPITKAGDGRLRSLMIEAAWTAIRQDGELREFYERIRRSHACHLAARVAIVAVAHKLCRRMHCVLRERRVYQARPG